MTSVQSPTSGAQTLDAVLRRIHEISTLPHIALKVIEVANDDNAGAADLKQILETDASLSARVLRYVNSAAYALRSKVTNLQHAISFLGFQQIRNLAMTASVSELFKTDGQIGFYRRSQLWRHLVSVGICARLIAMRQRQANFEDAFLAGLLHDIGIILEDQHMHARFEELMLNLDRQKSLQENERERLGFDHTVLGERVADAWSFPEAIKAAIRYHHASQSYRGEHLKIVQCVEVANLICSLKDICSVGPNLVKFPATAISGLSLTKDDIVVLAGDLDRELSLHDGLLTV